MDGRTRSPSSAVDRPSLIYADADPTEIPDSWPRTRRQALRRQSPGGHAPGSEALVANTVLTGVSALASVLRRRIRGVGDDGGPDCENL